MPLESAPEPRNTRLVPVEPPRKRRMLDGSRSSLLWRHSTLEKCRSRPLPRSAVVACVRNSRSKNAGSCSSIYRHHLFLGSALLRACYARVHISIYVYIYIYIYIYIVDYYRHPQLEIVPDPEPNPFGSGMLLACLNRSMLGPDRLSPVWLK